MTKPRDEYNWPVRIDVMHYRTHAGEAFVAGYSWAESSTRIADNAAAVMLIKPGSEMHSRIGVQASGDTEVQLFKDVTTSASTAARAVIIQNKSNGNSKTSDATIKRGSTALVTATTWSSTGWGSPFPAQFLAGGTGGNSNGGSIGELFGELNLSSAHTYAIRAINRSGVVGTIAMTLDWYEPHNRST